MPNVHMNMDCLFREASFSYCGVQIIHPTTIVAIVNKIQLDLRQVRIYFQI